MFHLFDRGHDHRFDRLDREGLEHFLEVDNRCDRIVDPGYRAADGAEYTTPLHDDRTGEDDPCRGVEFHGVAGGAAVDCTAAASPAALAAAT